MTRRIFCKVLLVVVAVFGLLVLSGVLSAQGRSEDAFERVKYVQERNIDRLMAMNGVEGTAIGYNQNDQLAVKVFTAGPGVRGIPQELEDVPVQVVVTGKFYALVDPTARFPRPVPTGVSTGHPDITAGTIGCRVTDGTNVYALSNNHVYANSNEATIDDNVLQPGRVDGGVDPVDAIGTLFAYVPIVFGPRGSNTIDAAIALSSKAELGTATPSDGYGIPSSDTVAVSEAIIGLTVQKYGRTTGLTQGVVDSVSGNFRVHYSSGFAIFENQIVIEDIEEEPEFSAGGDSGSLIVVYDSGADDDLKAVGLLFAGGGSLTIANPIDEVLGAFGVTIDDSPEGPVDNPPTVDITNPSDGATVSGTITIEADASDDNGVTQVEFFVDDSSIDVDIDSSDGWSEDWDTSMVADGSHTITAKATDTIGQTTSAAITVTVDNINEHPVANAGPDQSVNTDSEVQLDGTDSYDPDGDDITYSWAFVSEPEGSTAILSGANTATPTFVADVDGTYEVGLTVSDGVLSSTDSVLVTAATVTEPTTVSVILPSGTDGYATEGGRDGKKHLLITVALEDDLDNPVAGASVSIDLFLGEETDESLYAVGTGTTGTDGTVTFKVANAPSGTYTTDVTDVTAGALAWVGGTPTNSFTK